MVETRGSGSGAGVQNRICLTDDQILEIITTKVVATIRMSMPEMVGSIKKTMTKLFNHHYVALTEAIAATTTTAVDVAGIHGEREVSNIEISPIRSP